MLSDEPGSSPRNSEAVHWRGLEGSSGAMAQELRLRDGLYGGVFVGVELVKGLRPLSRTWGGGAAFVGIERERAGAGAQR